MTKLGSIFALILVSCCISSGTLSACGDKDSNPARGLMRGRVPSGKHQAILIVGSPEVRRALPHSSDVMEDLLSEGYEPELVSQADMAALIKERSFALVVAGPGDAQIAAAVLSPDRVLLVKMGASKQEQKEAKNLYSGVITKVASGSIVDDIGDALEVSLRAANQAKSKRHA